MKSRVKVVITALSILLFAVSLLVSCSDDVIEIKNNEHAYSEVLESNGVFVYKEQRYETLQTVVDSIAKGGGIQEEAITLSGNVKTRGITIPEKTHLVIDLKGYEIQFFDVEKSAINVGTNSSITVSNGSLTLFDKSSNLIVLSAGGDNSTVTLLTDLTIKAEGQIALYFDEGTSATLKKDVIIEGAVIAKGGKEKTELTAENYLGDVRMNGASLVVSERGCAVVNENNNENSYVESPTGTIIDNTGSIGPENVEKGVCYIKRGDVYYTFGGLKEAFISLVEDNEKVIFISDEDTEASEDFSLNRFVEVDFKGYKSGKNNISLESGSTLTLKSSSDISIFEGTITSAAGEASSLVLDNVEMKNSISVSGTLIATSSIFNDNITSTGDLTLTSSSFQSATADKPVVKSTAGSISMTKVTGVAGAVTASATGKDVTISNAEATATLTTGAVTAGNAVSLTGVSGKIVTVDGNVAGTSLSSDYAIIKGTVDLSENLTSSSSEFHGAVTANAVIDTGSTFRSNITSTGDLTLTSSSFQSATADKPVVKSTAGSISMTKVTGVAGAVTASATGKDVTISNAEATATLTTGAVTAGNAVSLTGVSGKIVTVDGNVAGTSLSSDYAIIKGTVDLSENLTSSSSEFHGAVTANAVIDTGSTFRSNITSTGDLTLTSSSFQSATADKPVVKSTTGSISMTKVTGVAGAVTASATGKDVTISNAEATATLTTGAVTAGNAVSLTGVSGKIVTVDGNVAGTSLSSDYAIIKGTVDLSENLTSSSSEFHGAVTANAVIDTGSTFRSNITSTGDLTLTSSSFQSATADKPVVKSTTGSISMTKVTGVAGAVTASATGKDVTISNAEATATLTTGAVTAGNAVSLTGVSGKIVTVDGSISGSSLVANYANLLGSVIATTSVEASNCTVGDGEAYIYSPVTSISNSKFKLTKIIGGVIGNIDVEADSLTITSPILYSTPSEKSSVSLIKVKNLTVTADNSVFSAGNVVVSKKAAINGGTYTGEFVFSGSEDSTIEAGAFSGTFSKTGNAALNITAGYFTGTSQTLNSGSTIIDGEHSSTSGWNTAFENLSVVSGTCVIKSGFFKASDAIQLNSLGSCISQDTMVSETKFVEIAYTGASIGGGSVSELSLPDSANKVIISFYGTNYGESSYDDSGYPVLASTLTFTYPVKEKVELKGRIVSNDNDYRVYANGRTLEGKELTGEESESIIWRRKGDSSPYSYEIVKAVQDGTQYLYHYDTVVVNYYTGNGTPANTTHYVSQAVCPGVVPVKFLTASEAGKDITDSADYRFTWNTGSANYGTEEYRGGGTDYLPTDYIPSLSENLNVYSYWYKPYITYKPNGATTGEDKIDVTAYNGSYTVWDNTGNDSFAKTGYTLSSWNTASAGSGTSYAKSDTLTNVIEDKTVYAIWTANTYTVKFDANGGTGTAMADLSFTYDEEKALTANTYTRADYTFKGWSTSSSATTAQYNNSQSVSNLTAVQNGTVTLYAVWEENGKIFNGDVVILGKNSSLYTDSELSTPAPGGTVSGNYKVYDSLSSGKYFSSKGTSYTVLSKVQVWNDNDARSSSNLNKDEMSAYGQTIMDKVCTKYGKDIFVSSSIWGSDVTAHYCYFKGGSINVYSNGINTLIAEGKNYALRKNTGTF